MRQPNFVIVQTFQFENEDARKKQLRILINRYLKSQLKNIRSPISV